MSRQGTDSRRARILVVDDHPVVRLGLAQLLTEDGFDVRGAAASLEEARRILAGDTVELVLIDLSLDRESGLTLLSELHRRARPPALVVYSVHEEGIYIRKAMESGAKGYVTKREDPEILLSCLRTALEGLPALSPRAARALKGQFPELVGRLLPTENQDQAGEAGEVRNLVDRLSMQELAVFRLMGDGLDTPDIARRLNLSGRTVETYYDRILAKLKLSGRRELRNQAILSARVSL